MKEELNQFMRLLEQPPARLLAEQVAVVLNCQPSDVRILVAVKLLKPLGNPPANSVKYFATLELLELAKDRAWLAKITNALNQHWQQKNGAKKNQLATRLTTGRSCSNNVAMAESGWETSST